jgi:hypothetical protein
MIPQVQITRALRFARPVLAARFDATTTQRLLAAMQTHYEAIAPAVPQLRVPFNRMVVRLGIDALVLYRALQSERPPAEALTLIQPFVDNWMDGQFDRRIARVVYANRALHRLYRRYWFATTNRADEPDGQRFEYLPPAGDLYYGVNVVRCGVVKLLNAQRAPEIAPFVCRGDDHIRKYLPRGVDFRRTQVIAEGGALCDFRYILTT